MGMHNRLRALLLLSLVALSACYQPLDQAHTRYPDRPTGQILRQLRQDAGAPSPVSHPDVMDKDSSRVFHRVTGEVRLKVLLVEFYGETAAHDASHYESLLFDQANPESLYTYYKEVSHGMVDVVGDIHPEWIKLPHSAEYYANGASGMGDTEPNVDTLARDAVTLALEAGVSFDNNLDMFAEGSITGLVIVHSGKGAEILAVEDPPAAPSAIWSLKGFIGDSSDQGVQVAEGLTAWRFLTIPEDAVMGLCAHELGHLVFQWADYYDYADEAGEKVWFGSGSWDLMASGSWSDPPTHPTALHKGMHGWITIHDIRESTSLQLDPIETGHTAYRVIDPNWEGHSRYLLLENRQKTLFDAGLPGHGLLVWRVNEYGSNDLGVTVAGENSAALLELLQADGWRQLNNHEEGNSGDGSDPFPGTNGVTEIDAATIAFSDLPSVTSLANIAESGTEPDMLVTVDVVIAAEA